MSTAITGHLAHVAHCVHAALRHPRIALLGAAEFTSGVGMTYDREAASEAYDAGRELAHLATLRRYEQW